MRACRSDRRSAGLDTVGVIAERARSKILERNRTKDWLIPFFLAVLICGVALFLFVRSLSVEDSRASLSVGTAEPHESAANAPIVESSLDPNPAPESALRPSVEELRARCVNEAKSGATLPNDPDSACNQFAIASRAELPAAREPPPMPLPSREPSQPKSQPGNGLRYVDVRLKDCRGLFGYGSIRYRECRAEVAERLRRDCIGYQQEASQASGKGRETLRALARSYCRESDRYRVTD